MSDLVDQPMTPVEKKQVCRLATFHCRCINKDNLHTFQACTFCKTCAFLVSKDKTSTSYEVCPFCHINESWKEIGHPCLACQFATIIYRNPFHLRFQNCLRLWLHPEDLEDNNSMAPHRPSSSHTNLSAQDMIRKRNLSFEHSFQEIKSKATPEQKSTSMKICLNFKTLFKVITQVAKGITRFKNMLMISLLYKRRPCHLKREAVIQEPYFRISPLDLIQLIL
jgi:hypothetical protein